MFWKRLRVTLCCAVALVAAAARAATLNVGPGQTYSTIQSAINAAQDFDTVLVAPGTYTENIDLLGKWITVTSSGGAAVTIIDGSAKSAPAVTIELGGTHIGGTLGAPTFSGFTVQNGGTGAATSPTGGIYVNLSSGLIANNVLTHNHCAGLWVVMLLTPPTVQNNEVDSTTDSYDCPVGGGSGIVVSRYGSGCVNCNAIPIIITGNTIQDNLQGGHEVSGGGGITILGGVAGAQIQNNTVAGNASAGIGGGIFTAISDTEVVQNLIYDNQAVCGGAGIATERTYYTAGAGTLLLANNTLANNQLTGAACTAAPAGNGGQLLFADEGSLTYPTVVVNNIVGSNSAQTSIACAFVNDAAAGLRDTPVFDHNLFFNSNGPVLDTASCTDPNALLTDLNADPQFAYSKVSGFQLQSTSPAIDAGNTSALALDNYLAYFTVNTATDFGGNPRLADATGKGYATIDIGAYEFAATADTQQTNVSLGVSGLSGENFLITAQGGSTVNLIAVVSSQVGGATGCVGPVSLLEDGAAVASAKIVAYTNTATFNNVFLAPGTHHFAASYAGQGTCSAGVSVPIIYIVSNYAPMLSLGSSPNPALVGQPVTFTVYISSGDKTQGGPITLTDTSTNTVLATLMPSTTTGFATFTTSTLALGAHPITASYAGDATHNPATASLTQYIVNGNIATTTMLASSENPAALGDSVTFTATVTSASGTPTGSVQFAEGATVYATVPVNYGSAQWSSSKLSLGQHVITATYVPTGLYTGSTASLTENIVRATTTTLTITAAGATVTSVPSGTAVTLTATVTSSGAAVTPGEVNFCDATANSCTDIHLLGTAQLTAAGTATLKLVPGPGSHSYYAAFKGTHTYSSSVSPNVPLKVVAAGPVKTTVGIQAAGERGNYTLLGTVATNGPTPPTGSVSFLDTTNANYNLGTAALTTTGTDGIAFLNTFDYPTPIAPYQIGDGQYSYGTFKGDNVLTADFNGDGIPDILIANAGNNTIVILLGNGDGTFTAHPVPNPGGFTPGYVAVGDFNADGKTDFAVTNNIQEGVAIYLGNGDGTFTPGQVLPSQNNGVSTALQVADFNGDGIADLVDAVTQQLAQQASLQVYLGNGDGTFTAVPTASPINGQSEVINMVVADFNGDGLPDVASTWLDITVMLGNGDGTFTAAPNPIPNLPYPDVTGIAAADLNQDGKVDLVATSITDATGIPPLTSTHVLLGNGDGTFTQLAADPNLAKSTDSVTIADFNNDGIPDMVLPDIKGGTVNVYLGRGDGTFIPDAFSPGLADEVAFSLAVADFNGDGQSDIAELVLDDIGFDVPPNDYLGVLLAQSPSTVAGYLYNVSPVGMGYHYVDVSYPGDTSNAAGISATIPLLAEQVVTTLKLTANPASIYFGQPVTLTATLSPFFAQNHSASGNISFSLASGTALGSAPVMNGVATLTITTLPVGTDILAAAYPGDTNFTASSVSTRSRVAVTVMPPPPPDFTISGPGTITFLTTTTNATPLTLASTGGFAANVALTCSAAIPQYVCVVTPSVSLPANGSAVATLSLQWVGLQQAERGGGVRAMMAAVLALGLLGLRRRRRWLGVLCLAGMVSAISACGSAAYPTVYGSYPVTVTAVGAGTVHSVTVTAQIVR